MPACSRRLSLADFARDGHPGSFQATPKVSSVDWDIIQGLDVHTLLCAHVVRGREHKWETAVGDICSTNVCSTVSDLFANLKTVKRAVCRTTHAKVLLFPSQSLILQAGIGMTDKQLIAFCRAGAVAFEEYFIRAHCHDHSIQEALKLYGLFYILEALEEK